MKQLGPGRVSVMMKNLIFLVALAACGHKGSTPIANEGSGAGSGSAAPVGPADTRNELEKRRDAACETLGPKVTQCAVDDAKRELAAFGSTAKAPTWLDKFEPAIPEIH